MKAQYLILDGFELPITDISISNTELNIPTHPGLRLLSGYIDFYIPYGIDIKDFNARITDLIGQKKKLLFIEIQTMESHIDTVYKTKINNPLITSFLRTGNEDDYYSDCRITFDCTDYAGLNIFVETVDLID